MALIFFVGRIIVVTVIRVVGNDPAPIYRSTEIYQHAPTFDSSVRRLLSSLFRRALGGFVGSRFSPFLLLLVEPVFCIIMAILRTRTFLVCLPLKAGVWVLALIGAMCGGGGAAGSWIEVTMLKEHPVPVQDQVSLVFQAVVFSLLGILSIFGLLSTLSKSVTAALIYSRLLVIHLIFTILSLIFTLYSTFRSQDQGDVKSCINGSVDEFPIEFCQKGWSTVTVLPLALFAAVLFNQLYAIVIARSYSEDLDVVLASRFSRSLSPDFVKNDATLNNLAYGPRIVCIRKLTPSF